MSSNVTEAATLQAVAPRRGLSVSLRGLEKAYGGRRILDKLDLEIKAGEFVAVVGRSGCGKSTLLRLVAGLEQATGGSVGWHGGAAGPAGAGEVRVMFQEPRLLPWKRVLGNVALGLGRDAQHRAEGILRQVGLGDRAQDWPSALSGGQRQRVALARALVHDPALLLLDELLETLDALTRIEMQQLVESLWLRRGFSAILVTHDVSEAVALADRVVLLEDGAVALDLRIDLPRPRHRGHPAFAALEERILARVLTPGAAPGSDSTATGKQSGNGFFKVA